MVVGFANGVFDLFHDGHRHFLTECRRYCSYLVVAVNADRWVTRVKGPDRPYNPIELRMLHVRGFAEAVIPFHWSPVPLMLQIHPDVVLRGAEQSDEGCAAFRLVRIGRLPGISTTLAAVALKKTAL